MSDEVNVERVRVPLMVVLAWIGGVVTLVTALVLAYGALDARIGLVDAKVDRNKDRADDRALRMDERTAEHLRRISNLEDNVQWRRNE